MTHCVNRQSLVCGSVMAVDSSVIQFWTSLSWLLKKSRVNVGNPTGGPRRRKPVVSSVGIGGAEGSDLFGCSEYFAMVLDIKDARVGSNWESVLIGESPDVDASMRVFIGLMKHPSGLPRLLKWSQRNSRSSWGTQVETSST